MAYAIQRNYKSGVRFTGFSVDPRAGAEMNQSYDWYRGLMLFSEPFGGVIPGARGAVLAALLRTDTPLTGRQVHALAATATACGRSRRP